MSVYGKIHSIETFGAVDGPGIRFVLFLQGCPLRCLYCHNPDSQSNNQGRLVSAKEIFDQIKKYINYIQNGGVTISGGEPLYQLEFTSEILNLCHQDGIHTAIDTSGCIDIKRSKSTINLADLIILDIKDIDNKDCIELTSHTNENALNTLNYCERIKKPVWIRHVLVPGYTLNDEKLKKLAQYLKGFKIIERVELLPFHKLGEHKYRKLGYPYQLYNLKEPSQKEIQHASDIFKCEGIDVF